MQTARSVPGFVPVKTGAQIAETACLADTIWHECFAEILSPGQIDYMVATFQSAGAMARQMAEEGYEYYLIVEGNGIAEGGGASANSVAPVGYVGICAQGGKLLLSKLYLLAAHRGKGTARAAMAFVEARGRALGCHTLWLTVNRFNARAIAVYRATGFTQTRTQVKDIGGGYVMDDFIFEKPL